MGRPTSRLRRPPTRRAERLEGHSSSAQTPHTRSAPPGRHPAAAAPHACGRACSSGYLRVERDTRSLHARVVRLGGQRLHRHPRHPPRRRPEAPHLAGQGARRLHEVHWGEARPLCHAGPQRPQPAPPGHQIAHRLSFESSPRGRQIVRNSRCTSNGRPHEKALRFHDREGEPVRKAPRDACHDSAGRIHGGLLQVACRRDGAPIQESD